MCSNFFDGIIPEASKIANPQVNSRSPVTSFDNSTQQSVSVAFKDGGFDAYKQGEKSGLNSTALIDDVNIWSSDGVDSL